MPRTRRAAVGNMSYHVINRGNGRTTVFQGDDDFSAFVRLIGEASERVSMRLAAGLRPEPTVPGRIAHRLGPYRRQRGAGGAA